MSPDRLNHKSFVRSICLDALIAFTFAAVLILTWIVAF